MDVINVAGKIHDWIYEHATEGVELLQRLVQSPSLPGHEAAAQSIVARVLEDMGLDVDAWEPEAEKISKDPNYCSSRPHFHGSPNVVGIWHGSHVGQGRSLLLNGHIDVVPVGDIFRWDDDPWSGRIQENRLYGRGSTDMKGGLVAAIFAVRCLKSLEVKLIGDLIVQSVVEEESGGAGTLAALHRGYRADAAIIPEPTGMRIFPKQQGSMWFRIHVSGLSAHGGTRYNGVSAIEKGLAVIDAIHTLEQIRNGRIRDPLYKDVPIAVPINLGIIQGGAWPSSVPESVKLEGRMGVAPNETIEEAKREFEQAVHRLCETDPWFCEHPPVIEWFGARWLPNELDPDHELVTKLGKNFTKVTGRIADVTASPWGTDGGLLRAVGHIPTVVFGPGTTEVAHSPNEYVEIDKVLSTAEILALTLVDWCGVDAQ